MSIVNTKNRVVTNLPKKFIIVPKYAPLYAMTKICAPTKGPIKTPIAVPLDIIRELLSQRSGTPEIFEVLPVDPGHGKFSKPVRLTLDNYKKPYKEILAATDSEEAVEAPVEKKEEKKVEKAVIPEQPIVESPVLEPIVEVEETPDPVHIEADENLTAEEPAVEADVSEEVAEVEASTEEVVEVTDEFTEPEIETSVMEIDVIPKTEDEESVEAIEEASETEEVSHDNQNNRKNRKNRHKK